MLLARGPELLRFGMKFQFLWFRDQYFEYSKGKSANERGLAIGAKESE